VAGAARKHAVESKFPAPSLAKVTEPVGFVALPGELSATVAVHAAALPTVTLPGTHEMVVDVERLVTVTLTVFDTS